MARGPITLPVGLTASEVDHLVLLLDGASVPNAYTHQVYRYLLRKLDQAAIRHALLEDCEVRPAATRCPGTVPGHGRCILQADHPDAPHTAWAE